MATEAQVIDRVRRRVSDFEASRVYEDPFYKDAIAFALSKLSFDFDTEYATVESVPRSREFLLVKLASIEMCYMRASRKMARDETVEDSGDDIASITVPDLSVSGPATSDRQGADYWLNLAQKLQDEYDGELEHVGGSSNAAQISEGVSKRVSLTTGGYRKRKLDAGPDQIPTVVTAVSGTTVTVSWDIWYKEVFKAYEVFRSQYSDMSEADRVAYIVDNHVVDFEDELVPSGTWYYQVKNVDGNELKTSSAAVEAVV